MNLVGSGSAILAVVLAVNPTMSPAFLFPLFAITTIAPQHLDITQSCCLGIRLYKSNFENI